MDGRSGGERGRYRHIEGDRSVRRHATEADLGQGTGAVVQDRGQRTRIGRGRTARAERDADRSAVACRPAGPHRAAPAVRPRSWPKAPGGDEVGPQPHQVRRRRRVQPDDLGPGVRGSASARPRCRSGHRAARSPLWTVGPSWSRPAPTRRSAPTRWAAWSRCERSQDAATQLASVAVATASTSNRTGPACGRRSACHRPSRVACDVRAGSRPRRAGSGRAAAAARARSPRRRRAPAPPRAAGRRRAGRRPGSAGRRTGAAGPRPAGRGQPGPRRRRPAAASSTGRGRARRCRSADQLCPVWTAGSTIAAAQAAAASDGDRHRPGTPPPPTVGDAAFGEPPVAQAQQQPGQRRAQQRRGSDDQQRLDRGEAGPAGPRPAPRALSSHSSSARWSATSRAMRNST